MRRVVGVLVVTVLAGCGATPPSPSPASGSPTPELAPATVRHFDGEMLSFDYPGSWSSATFEVRSSFSNSIVFLSTAPMTDPCDRTPTSMACTRLAVSALGPEGVLAEWSGRAFPNWRFDPTKGRLIQVAGRRATLEQLGALEGCHSVGGEREVVVTIDAPTPNSNWTQLWACLRGPSFDGLQTQIEAMLATVAWKP